METGLFAIMLVFGSAFTFFAFREGLGKLGGMLHILGLAFFLGLAIFMGSGYEVSTTITGGSELHYNGTTGLLMENVTKADQKTVLLAGGTNSFWLAFVFMGFSVMNLFMFIRDIYET